MCILSAFRYLYGGAFNMVEGGVCILSALRYVDVGLV